MTALWLNLRVWATGPALAAATTAVGLLTYAGIVAGVTVHTGSDPTAVLAAHAAIGYLAFSPGRRPRAHTVPAAEHVRARRGLGRHAPGSGVAGAWRPQTSAAEGAAGPACPGFPAGRAETPGRAPVQPTLSQPGRASIGRAP